MPDEIGFRGPQGSAAQGRAGAMHLHDRLAGGGVVLAILAMQTYWMRPAIVLLSGGLIVTYVLWLAAPWKNDSVAVLPIYLLAIAVQCLHFTEEYLTGFNHQFPRLFEQDWSGAQFVTFNMLWLALFVLAAVGVYRRVQLAYLIVIFLALIGGVGNGTAHIVLSAMYHKYFPGLVTAPFCLFVGVVLLSRLFKRTQAPHVRANGNG